VVTAIALMVGALLRLRAQSEEVAISAMLVLAVGSDPQYALARVVETLIGAVVGIAANLVVAPSVYVRSADRSLAGLAAAAAALLSDIGDGLKAGWAGDDAESWLDQARRLGGLAAASREELGKAEESLRYNPRRHRSPGSLDHLHAGKTGLEHVTQQVRTVARTFADIAEANPDQAAEHPGLNPQFADLLSALGAALRWYGAALDDPLAPGGDARVTALRESLVEVRRQHEEASVAMRVDAEDDPVTWSVNGSLLAATRRMLREIDPDTEGLHAGALRPAPPRPPLQALRPPAEAALRPVRRLRTADPLHIRERLRGADSPDDWPDLE